MKKITHLSLLFLPILFGCLNLVAQSSLSGYVTNLETSTPFQFVTVKAIGNQTYSIDTDYSGYYLITIDTGLYELVFTKYGYDTVKTTTYIPENTQVFHDAEMHLYPYAPLGVTSEYIGNTCYIEFSNPLIANEIIFDDGSFERLEYRDNGGYFVVKCTPNSYPAKVTGCRINFGDGSLPPYPYTYGNVEVCLFDDDGNGGLPGTKIDYFNKYLYTSNKSWNEFYNAFSFKLDSGSYYIGIKHSTNRPSVVSDTTSICHYTSYNKSYYSNVWSLDTTANYMIRSMVEEYGNISTSITNFEAAIVTEIEPCNYPDSTVLTPIAGFTHYFSGGHPIYYFAGAVTAQYSYSSSKWTYSNIIPPEGNISVAFNISSCNQGSVDSTHIIMKGTNCGFTDYSVFTDNNGNCEIDTVLGDTFRVVATHYGYNNYADTIEITRDTTISIELTEYIYPPYSVTIDSMTNVLSWKKPVVGTIQEETFEDELFPPQGWQKMHNGYPNRTSWWRDNNFSAEYLTVPPGDSYYAVAYTDFGSAGYHPLDFLITPQVDLSNSGSYHLKFDQYYTGYSGHSAYIEYSYDAGITWDTIAEMNPDNVWNSVSVDLSPISGLSSDSVWLIFHSSDHNQWGSGWAIDNISISADTLDVLGYNILLNGLPFDQVGPQDTSYFFDNLAYGYNYMACVNAIYGCGESDYSCDSWLSGFLHPVLSFNNTYITGNWNLSLHWLPPCVTDTDSVPAGLVSFILYQNDEKIDSILYSGQQAGEIITYEFDSIPPGSYKFDIEAVYDLSYYGFPGEYAVSVKESTNASIAWGSLIPYLETWDPDSENIWVFDDSISNWSIVENYGNPEPSIKFSKSPHILEPYESSITSSYIRADSLTLGKLVFSFDLRLNDINMDSTEMMIVEINNGEGWNEIVIYYNTGDMPWSNYEFDVSGLCITNFFQVRFTAKGERTNNIYAWYIDNIAFRRICPQPRMVSASVDWFTFNNPSNKIEWNSTEGQPVTNWLHYDNGETVNQFSDGDFMRIATVFTKVQLSNYDNCRVKKVKYFIADEITHVRIDLIEKESGYNHWLYQLDVTDQTQVGDWTEIEFDESIPINKNRDLWVALFIQTEDPSKTPISTDNSMAVDGYGNLFSYGFNHPWLTLDQFGIEGNLNLRTYIESVPDQLTNYPWETEQFYLYRMDESTTNYELYDSIPSVPYKFDYVYYDTVPNVILQSGYFYKVTALNSSELDFCESQPGFSKNNPDEDFVYIFLEGNEETELFNNIKIFPNPAKGRINVVSKEIIHCLTLFNISGNVVLSDKNVNNHEMTIDLLLIPEGLFILNIETENASWVRKVIIVK